MPADSSATRAKTGGTPLRDQAQRDRLLEELRTSPGKGKGGAPPFPQLTEGDASISSMLGKLSAQLESQSEQMRAQDLKIEKLATKEHIDDRIKSLESHMTNKMASMITEQVIPVREDLDKLQARMGKLEVSGLSGEHAKKLDNLEKMFKTLKKTSDIEEQVKCSKIMVIGGWSASKSEKDRLTFMDKLMNDLKVKDKVVKKGCHKLSKVKGGGLATVSFIEFTTKGIRDEVIEEAKKKSSGGLIFFKQKSKGQEERNDTLKALFATYKEKYPDEAAEEINWETREIVNKLGVAVYTQDKFGVGGKWLEAYQNAMDF